MKVPGSSVTDPVAALRARPILPPLASFTEYVFV